MLGRQLDLYQKRDNLINRMRMHLEGKNPIVVPNSMQLKGVATHTFHLNAIINEKTSRYRPEPEIKCIPVAKASSPAQKIRTQAAELEKAINVALYTLGTKDADAVWSHLKQDVHLFDAGVEKYLAIPKQKWPKLIPTRWRMTNEKREEYDEPEAKDDLYRDLESQGRTDDYEKEKDAYLHDAGIPIMRAYVPLERFYPFFEGNTMVECMELEERSLKSVLENKLFDTSSLKGYSLGNDGGRSAKVVILHFCDDTHYAYYALGPSLTGRQTWPSMMNSRTLSKGMPVLLHSFQHNLGRPLYNYVPGRGGGWKDGNSRMEPIMNAVLQLNQDQDDLYSQINSFIRNNLWATRVMKFSRESRGPDEGLPTVPNVPEGGLIGIWNDEEIENIVQNMPGFELARWSFDTRERRIDALVGSPALFGDRQPGVNTGYHQQLQVTMAEHLDAEIESALAAGAVNGVMIFLEQIRDLGEKMYVQNIVKDKTNKQMGEYVCIDPKALNPMPMLSAKVRDPRPMDMVTSAQAVMQLTQMRPGHNTPFVSDDWAAENIMGIEDPDEMRRTIWKEKMEAQLMGGPLLAQELGKRLGMALIQAGAPGPIDPATAGAASPAMQQAVKGINESGESAAMGGAQPRNLIAQAEGRIQSTGVGAGVGGGPATGAPQPQQALGRSQQILRTA